MESRPRWAAFAASTRLRDGLLGRLRLRTGSTIAELSTRARCHDRVLVIYQYLGLYFKSGSHSRSMGVLDGPQPPTATPLQVKFSPIKARSLARSLFK